MFVYSVGVYGSYIAMSGYKESVSLLRILNVDVSVDFILYSSLVRTNLKLPSFS
jgi:hypothetical protein